MSACFCWRAPSRQELSGLVSVKNGLRRTLRELSPYFFGRRTHFKEGLLWLLRKGVSDPGPLICCVTILAFQCGRSCSLGSLGALTGRRS